MSENVKEAMKCTDLAELARTLVDIGDDAKEAHIRANEEPKVIMVYDRPHLFRDGRLIPVDVPEPAREYHPDVFRPFTLAGLVEWLKADTDKFFTPDKPAALVVVEIPKEGKLAALFEADGGKWKTEAVKSVAAYLKEALDGLNLVVIG